MPASHEPRRPSRRRTRRARGPGVPIRQDGAGFPAPRPAADRVRRALRDHAHVERLSRTFRALGDPTRSKMVFALSLGELCVSDLAQALGATPSAMSHQLRILRDLDIVHVRREGKSQLYTLNEAAFGFCSPRTCQAWKSALSPGRPDHAGPLVRPGER